MLNRILIANRGEIATRIIKAAKQLNIETVLIYSSEDALTQPVLLADKAVCIGPAPAGKSYLNQEVIIQTALSFECEAIHPGYGFLSENAEFASKCIKEGLIFIGPSPEVISKMGDKQTARKLMMDNGVPTVPGSDGIVHDETEAACIAEEVGYPILLKATAGGGGRGMRVASDQSELHKAFFEAAAEAKSAFGNGDLYLEKLIMNPRHIEVQIMADHYGNVVHLGERDCSLQRRNQKMIEESPAYVLNDAQRKGITDAALKAAKISGYTNVGTVEFVLDQEGNYYFIEMNTRIQVEHPVTEMVAGIDLVREQLLIASGNKLSLKQKDIKINGTSIECRITAEDVNRNFTPSPGKIRKLCFPSGEGIRIETALTPGTEVSPWYDSMICKLIVHAPNREESIRKMRVALSEMVVDGVKNNIEFLKEILCNSDYMDGRVDTSFIGNFLEVFLKEGNSRNE